MSQHSPEYQSLDGFIRNEMRMSHIYQPVMLGELLRRGGEATVAEIATALLLEDRSQVEYYAQITKNMVGRVLTNNRGITEKEGDTYHLKGFERLNADEVAALEALCREKVKEYLHRRSDPWSHRRKSAGYISGTLRYEVLKRAKFRCELCGVSAEHRALEVDHIVPRNAGGGDEISNLQALCYVCNAMKRDRDSTDFRGIADSYEHRLQGCLFCDVEPAKIVTSNELCIALRDGYPVTELHTLIIPKRHVMSFFDLHQPELNAAHALLQEVRSLIEQADATVTGFNVGINSGTDAGQTIGHCHIHLIPRRKGDMDDPRGGVRGVIPERRLYNP